MSQCVPVMSTAGEVQGRFPQVWPYFPGWTEKISTADGPQWAERWAHEFSIVVIVMTTIIRRREEVPGRRQAPVGNARVYSEASLRRARCRRASDQPAGPNGSGSTRWPPSSPRPGRATATDSPERCQTALEKVGRKLGFPDDFFKSQTEIHNFRTALAKVVPQLEKPAGIRKSCRAL